MDPSPPPLAPAPADSAAAQRFAWVSNGAGGYVRLATPVWVRPRSAHAGPARRSAPLRPAPPALDEVRTSTLRPQIRPTICCSVAAVTAETQAPCRDLRTVTATTRRAGGSARPSPSPIWRVPVKPSSASIESEVSAWNRLGRSPPVASGLLAVLAFASERRSQASPSPATSATRYDVMGRVRQISSDPDAVGVGNPFVAVRSTYDAGRPIRLRPARCRRGSPGDGAGELVRVHRPAVGRDALRRDGAQGPRYARRRRRHDPTVTQYAMTRRAPRLHSGTNEPGGLARWLGLHPLDLRLLLGLRPDQSHLRCRRPAPAGSASAPARARAAEATWAYNLNGQVTTIIDGNGIAPNVMTAGRQTADLPFDDPAGRVQRRHPGDALATAGSAQCRRL